MEQITGVYYRFDDLLTRACLISDHQTAAIDNTAKRAKNKLWLMIAKKTKEPFYLKFKRVNDIAAAPAKSESLSFKNQNTIISNQNKTNMFKSIYSWLAGKILEKFLPGQKTIIFSWILKILGIAEMAASSIPNVENSICQQANICLHGYTWFGGVLTVIGVIVRVLRESTELFNIKQVDALKTEIQELKK